MIQLNYKQLENVLLDLKYKKLQKGKSLIFTNKKFDSIIVLPKFAINRKVSELHYSSVVTNILGKGVVKTKSSIEKKIKQYIEKSSIEEFLEWMKDVRDDEKSNAMGSASSWNHGRYDLADEIYKKAKKIFK